MAAIDAGINGEMARQIQDQVRKLTDKPILYVVNTNYPGDHTFGNYAFPGSVEFLSDLDGFIAQIAKRGFNPTTHETLANGVRRVTYSDPDGASKGRHDKPPLAPVLGKSVESLGRCLEPEAHLRETRAFGFYNFYRHDWELGENADSHRR